MRVSFAETKAAYCGFSYAVFFCYLYATSCVVSYIFNIIGSQFAISITSSMPYSGFNKVFSKMWPRFSALDKADRSITYPMWLISPP